MEIFAGVQVSGTVDENSVGDYPLSLTVQDSLEGVTQSFNCKS